MAKNIPRNNSLPKLNYLLAKPTQLYEKFQRKTRIKYVSEPLDPKLWPDEWEKIYFKSYSRFPELKLAKPALKKTLSLRTALEKRMSNRYFSEKAISMELISTLLYYSAGIKFPDEQKFERFYPSAGARYPLEIYLISNLTELDRSIYHYYVKNHSVEKLFSFSKAELRGCFLESWMSSAPLIIVITSIFKRNTIKYQDRGYRYILQEVGHVTQNLGVLSAALGLNCCEMGGFIDDNINKLLEIDGVKESTVAAIAIGHKPHNLLKKPHRKDYFNS